MGNVGFTELVGPENEHTFDMDLIILIYDEDI